MEWSQIKQATNWILDLIFPICCLYCRKEGCYLCPDCQSRLPRLETQVCVVCQRAAPFGKTHPGCIGRHNLDGIVSALPYANPATQKLIATYKYEFIYDLARPLTSLIIEACRNQELGNYFSDFTIVPVPLHKRRLNWRGFNQAELLGETLALELNISCDKTLVERSRFTEPQVNLPAQKRKTNIQNAFRVNQKPSGKYLLVDDVVTTGSTLNEIAKLLKREGAAEVWATTIAHG